jgi:hypothetical protein
MAYINQINEINLNNEINNELKIEWIIDRTPDHNIINNIDINFINNIQYIRNQQFTRGNQALMNGFISQIVINNDNDINDFIPFEPHHIPIQTEVIRINISDEERDCAICLETKDYQDITQINCGHKFCFNCIAHHIYANRRQHRCPLCRRNIELIKFQLDNQEHYFLEI